MLYSDYVTAIGDLLQYTVVDATSATPFQNQDINNILPRMIEYAELRMYREFDFISTQINSGSICTAGSRIAPMPSNIVVLQTLNIITPASVTDPTVGVRNQMTRCSIEFMNYTWPDPTVQGLPTLYALSQAIATTNPLSGIRVAPTPDAPYSIECVGTSRPAPLSSVNTSTFLSLNMPDMMISASMIFGSGFQMNYGAQSENPQLAMSWETIYQGQKAGLMPEELRKKAESTEWQPYLPSPLAPRA